MNFQNCNKIVILLIVLKYHHNDFTYRLDDISYFTLYRDNFNVFSSYLSYFVH